jgi:carbonic anhydrase
MNSAAAKKINKQTARESPISSGKTPNQTKMRILTSDLLAGVVVFIVAVPLSLGIALASGMPPVAALIAAIIGGVVVGAVSGAPIVVSGPAAGLSALVLGYVNQYGIATVYLITILAGLLQLVFGLLRIGRYISRIPKAILEGVLSAIGLTILLSQLHVLMGQPIPGGAVANILAIPRSLAASVSPSFPGIFAPALICGLLAVATQLLWPKLFKKMKWFPAALPATLVGTVSVMNFDVPRVQLSPMLSHLSSAMERLTSLDVFNGWAAALVPAIGLAIVASAESLLTARAIDILQTSRRGSSHTNLEKELLAHGMGNVLSGALGGMPMTGVMVRSAANFEAGAQSRVATISHGLFIGFCVLLLPQTLEKIPLAALASVLVVIGWRLLNIPTLAKEIQHSFRTAYLWPLTTIAILGTDLLKGFAFGIAVWLASAVIARSLDQIRSKSRTPQKTAPSTN